MRVQRVNRPSVGLPFGGAVSTDGQRRVGGEKPAHDLGVAVSPVVKHDQQAGQALHHVSVVVEEDFGHHHRTIAAHTEEVAFA